MINLILKAVKSDKKIDFRRHSIRNLPSKITNQWEKWQTKSMTKEIIFISNESSFENRIR
jgi:hypothetical protein